MTHDRDLPGRLWIVERMRREVDPDRASRHQHERWKESLPATLMLMVAASPDAGTLLQEAAAVFLADPTSRALSEATGP